MKKLVICAAAAFAVATLMPSAPALADMNYGPVKNGNQCWKDSDKRKAEFGFWSACPKTASLATGRQARGGNAADRATLLSGSDIKRQEPEH